MPTPSAITFFSAPLSSTPLISALVYTRILIGKGESPEQAVKEVGMVVEGINALPAAMELAAKYNVEMPIVQTVNAIVKEGMSASDALRTLMDRDRKNEMPQGYENNG